MAAGIFFRNNFYHPVTTQLSVGNTFCSPVRVRYDISIRLSAYNRQFKEERFGNTILRICVMFIKKKRDFF